MTNTAQTIDDFNIGEELCRFLIDGDFISESRATTLNSKASILFESDMTPLFESEADVWVDAKGHRITWSMYWNVYRDVDRYRSYGSVLEALGFNLEDFTNKTNMTDTLRGISKKFEKKHNKPYLGDPSQRQRGWSRGGFIRKQFEEMGLDQHSTLDPDEQPTIKDVKPGHRTKKTRTVKLFNDLNDQDILPGELYADYTRIPKSNWNSWVRFWDRKKTSVARDKPLFGKDWKKLFLFGYAVEQKLFYEIWYNTIDSSFSVHDPRGVELARRSPTMTEAIRKMFNHVVQTSPQDVDYDRANFNKQVQMSIARAANRGLQSDDRMKSLIDKEAKRVASEDKSNLPPKQKLKNAYGKVKSGAKYTADKAGAAAGAAAGAYDTMQKNQQDGKKQNQKNAKDAYEKGSDNFNQYGSDDDAIEGDYIPANSKQEKTPTGDAVRIDNKREYEDSGEDTKVAASLTQDRKEARRKNYEDALKNYQNSKKKADTQIGMMTDRPANSGDEGSATTGTEVKGIESKKQHDDSVAGKTKKPTAPKNDKKSKREIDSLFGDNPFDSDENEDESGYRRKPTKAEQDELRQMFGDDDDGEYDDFIDSITGVNESLSQLNENEMDDLAQQISDAIGEETRGSEYQNRVETIRRDAEKSSYTTAGLQSMIDTDLIDVYNKTKAEKKGKLRWLEKRFFKGRTDLRTLPTDKPFVFSRLKSAMMGGVYRADFVIGFSVSDRVNYEVWYVTEPNPDYNWFSNNNAPKFISSFYVYDITSERLIRKYVPYYRNAMQTVMQKLSSSLR